MLVQVEFYLHIPVLLPFGIQCQTIGINVGTVCQVITAKHGVEVVRFCSGTPIPVDEVVIFIRWIGRGACHLVAKLQVLGCW